MKIIMLGSNLSEIGGVQSLTVTLANEFIKDKNIDIDMINTGIKFGKEKYDLDSRINCKYINVKFGNRRNLTIINKLFHAIYEFIKIKNFFKHYNFDTEGNVIITFGHSTSCILPLLIKKKKNIKLVGSQHNPISDGFLYSLIRRKILCKLDKYILINKSMQEDLLKKYYLKNTMVIENPNTLIPNGRGSQTNKRVLAVGRLTDQKNFSELINIWNDIKDKLKGWKLSIVGEGPLKEDLVNQIKELNLSNDIYIENFTEEIEKEYVKSDILAMTSRYEGFGLVLVEAQSCGVPTIAYDCDFGPRNIINDGVDGYLIENKNKKKFGDALVELINDENKRKKFSEVSINNSKRFSIEAVVEKWQEMFREFSF